jgi:hypothetical protein
MADAISIQVDESVVGAASISLCYKAVTNPPLQHLYSFSKHHSYLAFTNQSCGLRILSAQTSHSKLTIVIFVHTQQYEPDRYHRPGWSESAFIVKSPGHRT